MKPIAPSHTHASELEPPIRLLAGGGSPFERQLVESARGDRMPAASLEHLARALEVPSAALPAKSFVELIRASQLARLGSLAGVGGLGLVAALALHSPAPTAFEKAPAPAAEDAHRAVAMSVEASPGAPTSGVERPVPLIAASAPAAPLPEGAAPRASSKSNAGVRERTLPARAEPAGTRTVPAPSADANGLRAELLALEAVQRALRAGQTHEAEGALSAYERRFPRAELALEAELLGIDVLLARGEPNRARAKARELLARPDAARYRARLEALGENGALGSEPVASPHKGAEVIQ